VPDMMTKRSSDAQFFAGHLWIMETGSWQVRFVVKGGQGRGMLSIPVAATSTGARQMQNGLGILLAGLGILLVAGMVGIVGAAAREAQTPPGDVVPAPATNQNRIYRNGDYVFDSRARRGIWTEVVERGSGGVFSKYLQAARDARGSRNEKCAGSQNNRSPVVECAQAQRLCARPQSPDASLRHSLAGDGRCFSSASRARTAGRISARAAFDARGRLSLVCGRGTREWISGDAGYLAGAAGNSRPALAGDDAEGTPGTGARNASYRLPDGYSMQWTRPAAMAAKAPREFTFQLLDAQGQPPKDMALYMGMAGHAAFVKSDGTVFAHIHPSGTVAMAALMMAEAQNGGGMSGMDVSGSSRPPNTVSFPYGFPAPGNYRIFVQMKHGSIIETGTIRCAGAVMSCKYSAN
jgi:hypothetical protein